MKINYEYTKKDYEKFLIKNRIINNIVLFFVGIVIYLYFSYNKISLIYLPIYVIGLFLLICILNIIYVWATLKVNDMLNYNLYGKFILEITPNKFSITINKRKVDYKYNQIKRLVERKKCFILKFYNSRESLIFEKKNFNDIDYNKIIQLFKQKIK